MPVYNAGSFLAAAIESLQAQTIKNWELIAVEDRSTDDSWKILKRFAKKDTRIKIFQNKRKRYLSGSLNFALKKAQGQYIARMDADDVCLPQRFAKQVELLESNSRLVAVGGQEQIIDTQGKVIGEKFFPTDPQACYQMIANFMPFQPPALMARAGVMKKLKYDTGIAKNDDIDMFFQLLQYGGLSNVDQPVLRYRQLPNSVTFSQPKKVFFMALKIRLRALLKYGYRPHFSRLLLLLAETLVVSVLPEKWLLPVFEALRVEKIKTAPTVPLVKRLGILGH